MHYEGTMHEHSAYSDGDIHHIPRDYLRIIREAGRKFVVMDTAPTGHSLLLMDATGAYHRQMMSQYEGKGGTAHLITPLMRLQDADMTRVLIVTLPEVTPVSQAAALQDDLRRARIEPWAWVINKSLAATGTRDPLLQAFFANPPASAVTSDSVRLQDMPPHDYSGFQLAHRKTWELDCNWKIASEAFLEAYHVMETHSQLMRASGDANTQYDFYGDNVNRLINVAGSPAPAAKSSTGFDDMDDDIPF